MPHIYDNILLHLLPDLQAALNAGHRIMDELNLHGRSIARRGGEAKRLHGLLGLLGGR